eukprot:192518_1
MGNDLGRGYGSYGALSMFDDRLDRRGWNDISDSAYKRLEEAKKLFAAFVKQYSFDTIPKANQDYKLTKPHVIKMHLVSALRPRFNEYVKKFDAVPKWIKLTDTEKSKYSKFKNRKSAVYFCNITITKNTKYQMIDLDSIAEQALIVKLISIGIPGMEAVGWITKTDASNKPKMEQMLKTLRVYNVSRFLDMKQKEITPSDSIAVETTDEYKRDNGKNTKPKRKRKSTTSNRKKRKSSTSNTRDIRSAFQNADENNSIVLNQPKAKRRRLK